MIDHQLASHELRKLSGAFGFAATQTPDPALTLATATALRLVDWHTYPLADPSRHIALASSCEDLARICHHLPDTVPTYHGRTFWHTHRDSLLGLARWHRDRAADIRDLLLGHHPPGTADFSPPRRPSAHQPGTADFSPPRRPSAHQPGTPDFSPPRRPSAS